MTEKLWHVVLLSFRPGTPETVRHEVFNRYQTLASDCGGADAGILFFAVHENLDLRKNVHLVEIAVFENEAALQRFRQHPKHGELTNILRVHADWQVGDLHLQFVPVKV
jgi:quinol monooxygenase YgiN